MTRPSERTPNGVGEHRLHLVAGIAPVAPAPRHEAETDENGSLVFSMLTLEVEGRS